MIEEIGRRVTEATEDTKETMYLFFRGVMHCHSSTPSKKPRLGIHRIQQFSHYLTIFSLQALCSQALKIKIIIIIRIIRIVIILLLVLLLLLLLLLLLFVFAPASTMPAG